MREYPNMETAEAVLRIYDALMEPFPPELVDWRVGPTNQRSKRPDEKLRGQPLVYIDARTVMDRLDSICGFDGWQNTYTPGVGTSLVCNIGILICGEWIWKADGAGASDMEPEKGTLSDAFKRAAVRWGVGRYLYEIKAGWMDLEVERGSAVIPKGVRADLDTLYIDFARKSNWGEASGVPIYRFLLDVINTHVNKENAKKFEDHYALQIARVPVAMRKHLLMQLGKIANADGS